MLPYLEMVRAKGVEPSTNAPKALMLPLHYAHKINKTHKWLNILKEYPKKVDCCMSLYKIMVADLRVELDRRDMNPTCCLYNNPQ